MVHSFNQGWYVIYVKPRQEKKVAAHLENKKVKYFLPTIKKVSQWHDRKKVIDVPLFPSYVFVFLRELACYHNTVMGNEGFLHFVKIGKNNAIVRENVINSIKILIDNSYDVEETNTYFKEGEQIIIKDGPFAGLGCEIVRHGNSDKVLVRIDLLKRNLLATLPVECLV